MKSLADHAGGKMSDTNHNGAALGLSALLHTILQGLLPAMQEVFHCTGQGQARP